MTGKMVTFGIIGLLALVAASISTCQAIRYTTTSPPQNLEPIHNVGTDLPQLSRLSEPRAILILDISVSMREKNSDPEHFQTEAVVQFFDLYARLATEIKEPSAIAVVLFGTIAQVIDWGPAGGEFLSATASNQALFRQTIEHYLGTPGQKGQDDPRKGQDTDYLQALGELDRLLAGLHSPPAVIFMTDGRPAIHPLFSPLTPDANQALATFGARQLRQRYRDGEFRKVPAGTTGKIFNRSTDFQLRDGPVIRHLNPPQERIDQTIREKVSTLIRRDFTLDGDRQVPMVWAPLFLAQGEAFQSEPQVRSLLTPSNRSKKYWDLPDTLIACDDPQNLPRQFVQILGRWMRMREVQIAPLSRQILIPTQTQAFALQIETSSPLEAGWVSHNGTQSPLVGRATTWANVFSGGCEGTWHFPAESLVSGGRYFLRPRFDWALHVPQRASGAPGRQEQQIEIFLMSLETGQPVAFDEVLPNLPEELSAEVQGDEGPKSPLILRKQSSAENPGAPAYRGALVIPPNATMKVSVKISLQPLQNLGYDFGRDTLERIVSIRPYLHLKITLPNGLEGCPDARGIPIRGAWARKLWERIRGSLP